MASIDPITGQPLPANAIQRVLFIGSQVHVYQIPPLTSTKGYTAATWTEDPKRHIFTARLRVLETGTESDDGGDDAAETVKVDVILEDPASGQLFAAAPYNDVGVVEPALDSSRFFAVRVQDGQGHRAMIGIGFEERPDAFDFGVALQEARKTCGLETTAGGGAAAQAKASKKKEEEERAAAAKRDYSLKEGETITINLGSSSKFGRRSETSSSPVLTGGAGGGGSFSLAPPPSASSFASSSPTPSGSGFSLPPPPPPNRRTANRRSVGDPSLLGQQMQQQLQDKQAENKRKSVAELGFDDGQFGEFA